MNLAKLSLNLLDKLIYMSKIINFLLLPLFVVALVSCGTNSDESENWPRPIVLSVSTEFDGKVVAGYPVELHGKNFCPSTSDNKVIYGVGLDLTSIEVTKASESSVVFIAPQCNQNQLSIRVSTRGKESNSVTLEYDNSLAEEDRVDLSEILDNATKVTVREGVEWLHFHGLWEGAVRNINIVKTTLSNHNRLGIYYDYKNTEVDRNLDAKCEFLDALIGTNGPMACCHFVRVDGKTMRNPIETEFYFVSNAALTIDNNVPDIVRVKDNFDAAKLPNRNIGCGGPMLVYEGRIQKYDEDDTAEFLKTTHPRTAFGITKDQKTVIQVAVDGRWTTGPTDKRAIGLPTPLLAKLMRGLGCYKALNFDGGGGTAMWIYGYGVNGIVNHPCDSPMNWDNPTLRPTGNAVYIYSNLK